LHHFVQGYKEMRSFEISLFPHRTLTACGYSIPLSLLSSFTLTLLRLSIFLMKDMMQSVKVFMGNTTTDVTSSVLFILIRVEVIERTILARYERFRDLKSLPRRAFGMDTLSLVLEYLKDLEECMDNEDTRVAKEMRLFDALEHKSIDAELDFADSANYVTEKVLDSMGFVHADFVVLDYANEGEPSIMFGRKFLATTKSQVDFGLGKIKMNLTMFEEVNSVVDLLEGIGSSS
ncbi:hypothetical protein Tco_0602501, partial [Tanacetum coccineum]